MAAKMIEKRLPAVQDPALKAKLADAQKAIETVRFFHYTQKMAVKMNETLQARDYLDKIAHVFVDGVEDMKKMLDSKDPNRYEQMKSTADHMVETFEKNDLNRLTTVALNKTRSAKAYCV